MKAEQSFKLLQKREQKLKLFMMMPLQLDKLQLFQILQHQARLNKCSELCLEIFLQIQKLILEYSAQCDLNMLTKVTASDFLWLLYHPIWVRYKLKIQKVLLKQQRSQTLRKILYSCLISLFQIKTKFYGTFPYLLKVKVKFKDLLQQITQ